MKLLTTFTTLIPTISALVVRSSGGTDLSNLLLSDTHQQSKRNSYQVGVHLYQAGDCSGPQAFPDRNHDEASCNAATITEGVANSALVKSDGTAQGNGCMTVYESDLCTGTSVSYTLKAGACINFDSNANGWRAGCVVVGTKGETCGTTAESCAIGGLIPGTGRCDAGWGKTCPAENCYRSLKYGICCQGPTPLTNPLSCATLAEQCGCAQLTGCCIPF